MIEFTITEIPPFIPYLITFVSSVFTAYLLMILSHRYNRKFEYNKLVDYFDLEVMHSIVLLKELKKEITQILENEDARSFGLLKNTSFKLNSYDLFCQQGFLYWLNKEELMYVTGINLRIKNIDNNLNYYLTFIFNRNPTDFDSFEIIRNKLLNSILEEIEYFIKESDTMSLNYNLTLDLKIIKKYNAIKDRIKKK
ncbi:hypothetical protein L1994_09135 [Methanomicrobium antiquum]|uniref:Uncharacterized protein n=1 Tax=Methanomicrobium antiquum TaxID=487686 RepID=A0AAF0FPM7_9EURY|nr:hypothetical protein [Methanomicrobium antiquum]WFN36299.1 hypothetical protein L1994_09135 [Methanomicrobium antiquum]